MKEKVRVKFSQGQVKVCSSLGPGQVKISVTHVLLGSAHSSRIRDFIALPRKILKLARHHFRLLFLQMTSFSSAISADLSISARGCPPLSSLPC